MYSKTNVKISENIPKKKLNKQNKQQTANMLDEINRAQEQRKNGRKAWRAPRFHAKQNYKKNRIEAASISLLLLLLAYQFMAHSLKMCIGQMKIAHNKYGCLAMAHDNNQIVTEK